MLAIIGGTGFYNIDGVDLIEEIDVATPFGKPSSSIAKCKINNKEFLFLPRHGKGHKFLPHEINYRANIFALKKLGAKQIISFSATGSLQEEIKPGECALPDQYFDFVKGEREKTFFGSGIVAHISTAKPICEDLTNWIYQAAKELNIKMHKNKTYACVDGPRLGTKAESDFLRIAKCDLVGMTNVPEVFLAREAQICYATVSIVTDYDCWMEDPSHHVTLQEVMTRYAGCLEKTKKLLVRLLSSDIPTTDEDYRKALINSILTKEESLSKDQLEMLNILRA